MGRGERVVHTRTLRVAEAWVERVGGWMVARGEAPQLVLQGRLSQGRMGADVVVIDGV